MAQKFTVYFWVKCSRPNPVTVDAYEYQWQPQARESDKREIATIFISEIRKRNRPLFIFLIHEEKQTKNLKLIGFFVDKIQWKPYPFEPFRFKKLLIFSHPQ